MSDKRTVATDALETLGTIIEDGGRDAIHLAVEPVIAGEELYPGAHLGIVKSKPKNIALLSTNKKLKGEPAVGIVDPFLTEPIHAGEMFWLVIYPRQIKSLRHVWSHPAFPDEVPSVDNSEQVKESIKWMERYAGQVGLDYEDILIAGDNWEESEDYLCDGGRWEGEYTPEEYWDHWENIRGRRARNRGNFFTCSC